MVNSDLDSGNALATDSSEHQWGESGTLIERPQRSTAEFEDGPAKGCAQTRHSAELRIGRGWPQGRRYDRSALGFAQGPVGKIDRYPTKNSSRTAVCRGDEPLSSFPQRTVLSGSEAAQGKLRERRRHVLKPVPKLLLEEVAAISRRHKSGPFSPALAIPRAGSSLHVFVTGSS
jgi:hypothetical protein